MTVPGLSSGVPSPERARGDPLSNRVLMDRIAAAFDATRSSPWPQVLDFLDGLTRGARVLDLAAGNGRHTLPAAERGLEVVALDVSSVLPRLVTEKAAREGLAVASVEGDALRLPFADAVFDHVLFIAGLHCIEGRGARVAAVREVARVLRPGGSALVSVWARNQPRYAELLTQGAATGGEAGDIQLAWKQGQPAPLARFFHLYTRTELEEDLGAAGLVVERVDAVSITRTETPDNLFAVARVPGSV